jgi:hypothetical protein
MIEKGQAPAGPVHGGTHGKRADRRRQRAAPRPHEDPPVPTPGREGGRRALPLPPRRHREPHGPPARRRPALLRGARPAGLLSGAAAGREPGREAGPRPGPPFQDELPACGHNERRWPNPCLLPAWKKSLPGWTRPTPLWDQGATVATIHFSALVLFHTTSLDFSNARRWS